MMRPKLNSDLNNSKKSPLRRLGQSCGLPLQPVPPSQLLIFRTEPLHPVGKQERQSLLIHPLTQFSQLLDLRPANSLRVSHYPADRRVGCLITWIADLHDLGLVTVCTIICPVGATTDHFLPRNSVVWTDRETFQDPTAANRVRSRVGLEGEVFKDIQSPRTLVIAGISTSKAREMHVSHPMIA